MGQVTPLASVASAAIDTSPFIYLIEGKAPRLLFDEWTP